MNEYSEVIYGLGIIVSIFMPILSACQKHMDINRGNFINIPTWRKVSNTSTQILLYIILGSVLWKQYNWQILVFCSVIIAALVTFSIAYVLICFIRTALNNNHDGKFKRFRFKFRRGLLNDEGIPSVKYQLNNALIEYIVYAICWTTYRVLITTVIVTYALGVVNESFPGADWCNLIIKNILPPLITCRNICLAAAFDFSVWFIIIVITVERIKGPNSTSAEFEQEKLKINRNFQRREHDV